MSRSSHHQRQLQLQQQQQQQMAENDAAALAAEIFDHFCVATTMRQTLGLYRNMCDTLKLRPGPLNEFYPKLKAKIRSWKAQALWKKFDARASHRVYNKGNACTGTRVLVIGAGPCGLRTAIEAQLLGAKVVVVEKRDRISRNNVLHLWPFVITDLRNLGAKKFYGKFCAGSIDHISIRQLQCILLKVALLLGVEVHEGVSFLNTIEPSDECGWRAQISPEDHAVSHYEFDVLIGADGKRNTLEGFKRKEFRGKLAIAITANFINKKTEAEAKAEEISGVAFIFNQSFFKELYQTTGIDLENIVYYKDETHYFVMTAKKHSLIDKGVIIQDFADPAELLAPPNVNTDKLLDYAREAAGFSTKYQMPNLEFAVNHYGKPDVAMFDFTSMFAAETSCRVLVRKNYRLLQCLVGDSLLEPFWPTGSGCARGFLSSMDSAYAIKLWTNTKNSILGVLAQRESIYRLLAQTTPENLHRDIGAYTVDPATRYPNLNRSTVNVWQVKHLVDTDDDTILEQTFMDTNAIQAVPPETPIRRKRRSGDTQPLSTVLLRWIKSQLLGHEFSHKLTELSECFTGGNVLCALINRYRPDLVDLNALKDCSPMECNEVAFKILESELNIPRIMSAKVSLTLENIDSKIWLNYLEQICEVFRGEIPHVKHPKLDFAKLKEKSSSNAPDFSNLLKLSTKKAKSPLQDIDMTNVAYRGRSVLDEEKLKRQRKAGLESNPVPIEVHKRAKKRRSHEKSGNIEERQQRLQEIEANRMDRQSRRRLQRFQQTQNFYKSLHMLQAETFLRDSDESSPFEDYSIYMYRQQAPEFNDRVKELERKLLHRDKDRGNQSALPRGTDEHFSDRIKSMEQRITSRNAGGAEKKPKDLLRAIGKIESSDWNIREIEKKIEQSKRTEIGKTKEKVPKWSKEQFVARQNKMSKPDRQESVEEKFKEIDQTLKNLDKQLKEGSVLEVGERGKNKVASIAGQFGKKEDTSEEKSIPIQKSPSKVGLVFNKQPASEKCHFCRQTVYVMEKISTEGLILHRSCLKCHHCHTNLRLGGYAFDRDDPVGRFYCTQHFRLPAKAERPVARRGPGEKRPHYQIPITKDEASTPARGRADNVAQLDLLDRGQTPERIEFENVDAMSDGEPSLENIIDENEWTDRNFITGSEESESDLSSSDSSDEESDSDVFEEANGSPIGAQTLQLATDWIGKQRYSNIEDSDEEDFYDSSEGLLDDDAESQTEGEEFKKAREMRRQEVKLMPPPAYLPTDTETEVVSIADSQQTNIDNKNGDTINLKIDSDTNLNAIINDLVLPSNDRRVEGPTKTDIQMLERNLERKVSTEIDALNENLYNLNNLIKLNKEVVTLKRQNSVKDDIMKKLSLKEKWLNDTEAGNLVPANQNLTKDVVDNIVEDVKNVNLGDEGKVKDTFVLDMGQDLQKSDERKEDEKKEEITIETEKEETTIEEKKEENTIEKKKEETAIEEKKEENTIEKKKEETAIEEKKEENTIEKKKEETAIGKQKQENTIVKKKEELKIDNKKKNVTENVNQKNRRRTISDIKTGLMGEKKNEENELQKQFELRRHSFRFPSDKEVATPTGNKSYDGSELQKKFEQRRQSLRSPSDSDVGKLLYNAESKPPKHEENMTNALKNIEVKNFSDTMDTIKSLITTPKVSKQSSVDISKYFPNQKLEKSASVAKNVNQKTLKDVDLSKYFPKSPEPKRKGTVPTVASKMSPSLRRKSDVLQTKSGTDSKSESKTITTTKSSGNISKDDNKKPPKPKANILNKPIAKRNALAPNNKTEDTNGNGLTKSDSDLDIFDQLLDGAMDIKAVENSATNKSPKIVRKSKNDGSTTKKKKASPSPNSKFKKKDGIEKVLDANEQIFEEILQTEEVRSPSVEYQKLFNEEKSPSADLSDRIEQILIDNNATSSNPKLPLRKKKLAKQSKNEGNDSEVNGNKVATNQNGGTSNESCPSLDGSQSKILKKSQLISPANDVSKGNSMDLNINFEKTMEYLKAEWRKEAENFLQKKRDSFYAKRRGEESSDSEEEDFGEHIINQPYVKKLENVQEEEDFSDTDEILNGIIDDMQKETENESVNEFIKDILIAEKENMKISNNNVENILSDSQETLVGSDVKLNTDHENNVERSDNIVEVNAEDGLQEKTIPDKGADLIDRTENKKAAQPSTESVHNTINEGSKENSGNVIDEVEKDMGSKVESDKKEQEQSNKVGKILFKTYNVVDDITSKGLNISSDLMSGSDTAPLPCAHKEIEKINEDLKVEPSKRNVETKEDISEKTSLPVNKPENNISKNLSIPDKSSSNVDHSVNEKDAAKNASSDVKIEQSNSISAENTPKQNENYSIQFNKVMAELGNMSKLLKETKRPIVPKRVKKSEKQSLDSETKDYAKVEECKNNQKINGNDSIIVNNIPQVDEKQKLPVLEKPESKNKPNNAEVDSDDSLLSDIELNDLEVDQLINEIMHEFGDIKENDKEVLIDEILNDTVEVNSLKLAEETANNASTVNTESACEYSNKLKEKSSSEDSIEKLFNEFTDDMLVDVEFDSNDEIISIIPKGKVAKEEGDLIRKNLPELNEKIAKDSITHSPDVDVKSDLLAASSIENKSNDIKCAISEDRMSKENNNQISDNTSLKYTSILADTDIKQPITELPENSKNEIAPTTFKNNLSKAGENIVNESNIPIHRNTMDENIVCEGDTSNKNYDVKSEHTATAGSKSNSPKSDADISINEHRRNSKDEILSKNDDVNTKSGSPNKIADSKIDNKSPSLMTSPLKRNSKDEIHSEENNKTDVTKSVSPSSNVKTKSKSPNKIPDSKIDNKSPSLMTSPLKRNSKDEIHSEENNKTDATKSVSPSSNVKTKSKSPNKIPDSKIDKRSTSLTNSSLKRNSVDEINREENNKTDATKSVSPSSNVKTKSKSPNKIPDSKIDKRSTSLTTSPLKRNSVDEINREENNKTDATKSVSPSSNVKTKSKSPNKISDSKIDKRSTSLTTSPLKRNSVDEINREENNKTDATKSVSPSSNVKTKSKSPNKIPDSKINKRSPSLTTSPLKRNSVDEIDRERNIKIDANKSISPSSDANIKGDSKVGITSISSRTSPLNKNCPEELDKEENNKTDANKSTPPSSNINTKSVSPTKIPDSKIDTTSTSSTHSPSNVNSADTIDKDRNNKTVTPDSKIDNVLVSSNSPSLQRNSANEIISITAKIEDPKEVSEIVRENTPEINKINAVKYNSPTPDATTKSCSPIKAVVKNIKDEIISLSANIDKPAETSDTIGENTKCITESISENISDIHLETVTPIRPLRKNDISADVALTENVLRENMELVSGIMSPNDTKAMNKSATSSPEIDSKSLYPIKPLRKYDRTADIDKKNDEIVFENSSSNSARQLSELSKRSTPPPINEKVSTDSTSNNLESNIISPVRTLQNFDKYGSVDESNIEDKITPTCDLPIEKNNKIREDTSPIKNNETNETMPILDDNNTSNFPIKPLRRNRSVTSSTSPEPPNPPTRGRRLSQKLNPTDMPPSVQDILRDIENNSEKTYFVNLIDETTPKFPIMKDEEEEIVLPEETKPKTLPRTKRSKSREKEPLTELEYIERLEMERREALIKRDEMYASLNKPINLTYAEVLKENLNDRVNNCGQEKKYCSSPSIAPRQYNENNRTRDFISVNPVNKSNDAVDDNLGHTSYIKEKTISSSPLGELPSTKMRIKRQYSEENPRREIISASPINSYNKETHVSADSIFSPSKSILSRSSEQIPHRSYQRISNPMDRGTQILLDRSKMLHNMKEDFMTEKNAGNNPYLKKMISTEKVCPDVEEYIIQNMPRDERPRQHFPTSRSIESKRYLNRTPDFSTSSTFNRPHNLSSSAQSPRNFVEYFKKSPSHHKDRGRSKDSCVVQSDSESSSADGVELNSATEISTDSEFDHDPIIREAPRIFIDDTHLRKPTKVQVKQGIITSSPNHKVTTTNNQTQTALKQQEIEFKPLVQVDPSLLNSNRMPLKNPRPGDYLLNKTPSTEGIASKKSLELKKRYLLGEQGIGNGIMKSGSTSILDSKFKNFHSNISECQKLLNPGSDISPSMKTFLDRTKIGDKIVNKSELLKKDIDEKENVLKNNINNKNKGKDYSETVNTALVENISKEMKTVVIIETIDLTTPEKSVPIIDLTTIDIPSKMVKANQEFIEKLNIAENVENDVIVIDDSPFKKEVKSLDEQDAIEKNDSCEKPDVSKDVKEIKPDIITQIEENILEKECILPNNTAQASPIKDDLKPLCPTTNENDVQETSIEVPNIPWNINKTKSDVESDSLSSSSSSLEDIPHFILDSTTSPDTHNEQIVPRVEIHDTSGALMQIDSLMIIDGKYIGDPEDLKHMEIPVGTKIELPKEKSQEILVKEEIKDTLMSGPSKPDLKFDTKNENKIDTLKNLPMLIEQNNENAKLVKPTTLELNKTRQSSFSSDKDKTPTAEHVISDSETEVTGQVLTETELSDWTADDVVSENFVDIEFALNSNKGTIKRNKKGRKKHLPKIQHLQHQQQSPPAPPKILDSPKDCGILRNLDIEEIEFMDTGSEGSCAEAYAATNKAMLQNRGYIEFIENAPPPSIPLQVADNEIKSLRAEIYSSNAETTSKEILGVDYIEQGACILSNDIDLKTPVNEIPSIFTLKPPQSQLPSTMTDSINDIDDDSLALINSQGATNTTTTEDSDALTVVTSPCEPGPKNLDNQNTPSSSEKNDKTISSSGTKIPVRKTSGDEIRRRTQEDNNKRKDSDELSYEEYVRKLQMKITQISNARDSIDVRKQKRKSSKGEMIENTQNNSVIENKSLSIFEPPKGTLLNTSNNNQAQQVHKVPEIPTLTRKLEEITKERTKQKDLIHDLVMDKLQSKKQLNAEKRLNRSRNRNMFNSSGVGVPSTPKVASNGCTNSPHYHITCSDRRSSKENLQKNQSIVKPKNSPKENKDFIQNFKNSPRSKQRPLSDNLDQIISFDQTPKLSKTRSFCVYNTAAIPTKDSPTDQRNPFFGTPLPPPRISKNDPPSSANTDKLRADARARARLKSNQELGLSPEEKLQLLRKRYHIELHEVTDGGSSSKNKSDDLKARDRKMVTSKSVNDISAVHTHLNSDENFDTKPVMPLGDFTSDPNLSQGNQTKTSRRRKDPERRKSLIQTVSNFFNKKKEKELSSPAKEKPEGVFSRFRISPKTKEKSKDKEGLPFDGISSQDCLKYEVTSYSSSPQLGKTTDDTPPPPIPPLPLNYQRSDDESYTTESREQKKQRAISKASRQAELKRLRIAQEIQREQEEIEVKLKELEARGVLIEKALRGEGQNMENIETSTMGANDEKLLKELLEICRNTTQLKKRDEELGIRQQELQLEHRHAQLKEELNIRLSYSKLDKSSADVAAEGAILNEMLEIVAKRAALRPNETGDLQAEDDPDV